MFVNKFMLNMLSDNVLGIPIVVKLGKKNVVKSIYSIPYKTIGQYLSNVHGNFIGDMYAIKSPSLARLVEYSRDFDMNDWYSVEAVKAFFDIEIEDDIDKNVIAWYNPYVQKIMHLTDAHKNPVEKPQDVINQIIEKYFAKNNGDKAYFVNIKTVSGVINYNVSEFYITKAGIAKRITSLKKNMQQWKLDPQHPAVLYLNAIESIPACRFMETVILANIEKAICVSYSLSDNHNYSWSTIYNREELLSMQHLTRMKVALDLFYKNSILAFKGLVENYGDISNQSIGSNVLKNHFSEAQGIREWEIYTDSFYRIVALCMGYCSSNTAVSLIAKNWNIEELRKARAYDSNTNAVDAMLGPEKAFLASWFSECFYGSYYPSSPLTENFAKYNYRGFITFLLNTVKLLERSTYVAFNGDIMAYYKNGKEFYDYAKM